MFPINISAGEFFELIRPAVLICSAILSTLVLASARSRFGWFHSFLWAVATFFLPFVVLPVYWFTLIVRKPAIRSRTHTPASSFITYLLYLVLMLVAISLYVIYNEQSADSHLARAAQAKVNNDSNRAILEYEKALTLEDNPHTRKLLALALMDQGRWSEALSELRLAEDGNEPDDLIHFWLGQLLERFNLNGQAALEYKVFLTSSACTQALPDLRCNEAQQRLEKLSK